MENKPTLIILAAGQGTRLRPLTNNQAKCMVPLHGKPLLQWQINAAKIVGFERIVVVRGFAADTITVDGVIFVDNHDYAKTNMPVSLWAAREYWGNELVIAYGDIVYEAQVLTALLRSQHDFSVIVDLDWHPYWAKRFENVLSDAETLRYTNDFQIEEIGKKPEEISEIQGQYIGLSYLKGASITALKEIYEREQKAFAKNGYFISPKRNLNQLYMTDVIQGMIDWGSSVYAVPVHGKWLEVDSARDLHLAEKFSKPVDNILSINRDIEK